MFPDHSLMPREALRLAALGILSERPLAYGALARDVRGFVSHIMGPSPEAMGSSLELLRYEGLICQCPAAPETGDGGAEPVLTLTAKGRKEFTELMQAAVRAPFNDLNKLVVALKMRFLPLLPAEARREQADLLADACRAELARMIELRGQNAGLGGSQSGGPFLAWLDHDIAQAGERLAWFESLGARLAQESPSAPAAPSHPDTERN